ncbi:class I SAM-dependent methyltransferase [Streptomyces acidicola]|uniref:class I SAM-dependent methyltransferase n=1 Tax=Streptomyces acidicola TaxID=2596892 RepID=UPI0038244F94
MTDTSRLTTTRNSYDAVAADYERLLRDHLTDSPFDRAMLGVFAERVLAGGGGPVGDLGCGPGRLTGHLGSLGLDVLGIELSPEMVAVARRVCPGLRFEVGSMTALDLKDESLAGAVVWYSTVHTNLEELPVFFEEFHRVLAPGGHLLMAFKLGDEHLHLSQAYGHDLDLDVYRSPARAGPGVAVRGLFRGGRTARVGGGGDGGNTPQGYLLVRGPAD